MKLAVFLIAGADRRAAETASDVTYVATWCGSVHVASVIDLFSWMIASFAGLAFAEDRFGAGYVGTHGKGSNDLCWAETYSLQLPLVMLPVVPISVNTRLKETLTSLSETVERSVRENAYFPRNHLSAIPAS